MGTPNENNRKMKIRKNETKLRNTGKPENVITEPDNQRSLCDQLTIKHQQSQLNNG